MYRLDKIMNIVAENTPIDRLIEVIPQQEYYEIIGEAGGDVLQYRIYNNGMIVER